MSITFIINTLLTA